MRAFAPLAPWLAGGWIAFVVASYLDPPPELLQELGAASELAASAELLALLALPFAAWFWRTRRDGRLEIGAASLAGAFLLELGIVLLRVPIAEASPPAAAFAIGRAAVHLLASVAGILLGLALLSVVAMAFGRRVLRWLGIADEPLLWVPSLALGAAGLANGALALAWAGGFGGPGGLALLGLLGVVGAPEWGVLARRARSAVAIAPRPPWLVLASGWVVVSWAALAFASLLRATPVGWDDLTAYMNRAQELAASGMLVPGGAPYPVELLYGLGFVAARGLGFPASPDTLALYVAWWGGLLGLGAIVWLGGQARSWQVGWVAAAIYCTLPVVIHLSTSDMKVDPLLAGFLAMSLGSALRARRERDNAARSRAWHLLAGLFLGFALSIKATAVFALCGLAAVAAWDAAAGRAVPARHLCVAALAAALSLAPWAVLHAIERGGRIEHPLDLATGLDPAATGPETLRVRAGFEAGQGPAPTGLEEERGRYRGYEVGWLCTRPPGRGWLQRRAELPVWCIERHLPERLAAIPLGRVLSLPWDVSLGRNVGLFYASVGPLFLACLPAIGLLALARPRAQPGGAMPAVALFAAVHLAAWSAWAWGIPWYGIGMFAPFALLIADFATGQRGIVRTLVCVLLGLGVGLGLLGLTERVPRLLDAAHARGTTDREQAIRARFPGLLELAETIDSAPFAPAEPLVLRVGTLLPYFVERHRERLIDDSQLDQWNGLDGACDGDDACVLAALRRAGVRWVVYDRATAAIDATPERSLQRKALRFEAFSARALVLRRVDEASRVALFEVPGSLEGWNGRDRRGDQTE